MISPDHARGDISFIMKFARKTRIKIFFEMVSSEIERKKKKKSMFIEKSNVAREKLKL